MYVRWRTLSNGPSPLSEGEVIEPSDLPTHIAGDLDQSQTAIFCPRVTEDGVDLGKTIEEIERCMINEAMSLSGGVKARAATLLKLNRTTLVEKIKRLQLEFNEAGEATLSASADNPSATRG